MNPVDDENSEDEAGHTNARAQLEPFSGAAPRPGGKTKLAIRQDRLRKANRATNLRRRVWDPEKPPNRSTVDVSNSRLWLYARRGSIDISVSVPIKLESADPLEGRRFDLPLFELNGLAPQGERETLRCRINSAKQKLKIHWARAILNLTTLPPTRGAAEWDRLDWSYLGQFDPLALTRGLEFACIPSRKNKHRPGLGIIETAGGRLWGGQNAAVTIVEDRGLGQISLRIAVNEAKTLAFVLSGLLPGEAHFSEAETHYKISGNSADCSIICVIEKPKHAFPPVDYLIERPLTHCLQISTGQLLERLCQLHAVVDRKDEDFLQINYEASKLYFRVESRSGTGEAHMDVSPTQPQSQPIPPWSLRVKFELLWKIVKKASAIQLLEFGVIEGHMLVVRFDGGAFRARAFLDSPAEN